jgi:hypothetical protein
LSQRIVRRNDASEFARRTRRNLEFIENAKQNNSLAPVHVVTQLTLSLLGIVVFPYERLAALSSAIVGKTIGEMKAEGWLGWTITLDHPNKPGATTESLNDLLWHLRNSVAHGRLKFNSDSADLADVAITAEDAPKGAPINWRAEINGDHLREFCFRFLDFIDGVVG